MSVLDTSHELTSGLQPTTTATLAYLYDFTNPDAIRLVEYANQDVVTYRQTGLGKVVYIGNDFLSYNSDASLLISNAVKWAGTHVLPHWLSLSALSDTVLVQDSVLLGVNFNATELDSGSHEHKLVFISNDTANSQITVPVTIDVVPFPIADFSVSNTQTCDGFVGFFDETSNSPISWDWDFGDGGTSNLQHPVYQYSTNGYYSVELTACNALGCDNEIKPNHIEVTLGANLCDTFAIPYNNDTIVATCEGRITDSGGGDNDYLNYSVSTITIAPPGDTSVSLVFESFYYLWGDFLEIYDGPDVTSPLIGTFTGIDLPLGGTVTSSAGMLTLRENTNSGSNADGFVASWSASGVVALPEVAFYPTDTNPLFNTPVSFINLSDSNSGNWLWDFGDGNYSNQKQPVHVFENTGQMAVKLIASNCMGSDTAIQIIEVQQPPLASISPL
jgi:PKD repeat protein